MELAKRWSEYVRHWKKGALAVFITALAVLASVIYTVPVVVVAEILGYNLDDGPVWLCWAIGAFVYVPYFLGRELWRDEMIALYTAATTLHQEKK
jgi:hypothetical protein